MRTTDNNNEDNTELKKELEDKARNEGCMESLGHLMTLYEEEFITMAYKWLRHRQDAEDMVAHSYEKAIKKWDTFRGESEIRTWLYRIIVNSCKNFIKKTCKAKDVNHQFQEGWQDAYIVENADPMDLIEGVRLIEMLEKVLDKVPEAYSECYNLYEQEGLTYREIAETMKVPVGTVRSRIYKVRQLFLAEFKGG